MQHIMGGFKSGVIVGVITGTLRGLSIFGMGFIMSYIRAQEFRYMGDADLSIIWISVMAAGYFGIVVGLILGFSLGLFYSTRGYEPAQTNLDVMYFALLCAISFFGVIEVKMAQDWLPSGFTKTSGVFWSSTLVLFSVAYILYRFIRRTMHSTFLARLSFMLLYRWTLLFALAMLAVSSVIWLITPTPRDWWKL